MKIQGYALIWFSLCWKNSLPFSSMDEEDESQERLYDFKKCSGSGCPYMASWLVNVNLYSKAEWWLHSTKMEAASFNIFDKAKFKFQFADPDAYFVHHMSMYEHLNHKKLSFDEAKLKSELLSNAAFHGECSNLTGFDRIEERKPYLSLIPFYGGLPPNVTKDRKVHSLGQGNSLMSPSTKALQCMATVCSCLRYFGHVIIGTVSNRPLDRKILTHLISTLRPEVQKSIHLISIKMEKPAHLPFNLLAWGQDYVQRRNCPPDDASVDDLLSLRETGHFASADYLRNKSIEYYDHYGICSTNVHKRHHGAPYHVTFYDERLTLGHGVNLTKVESLGDLTAEFSSLESQPEMVDISHLFFVNNSSTMSTTAEVAAEAPVANYSIDSNNERRRERVKFIYYSECDQVVRFDTLSTLRAVSAALNDTTFFTGRRKEKRPESAPEEYMNGLEIWRNCGAPGYSMIWPRSNKVQIDA